MCEEDFSELNYSTINKMGNWERNNLENLYKRGRKWIMDLFCYV
jgi:hypothetical protein